MDENLRIALQLLVEKDDEGVLFDRLADMETWRSEELENALDVIRAALEEAVSP
ncbi:hypothetical protein [Sphingopyxis sp. 550A]|jgi:hypothetical protein